MMSDPVLANDVEGLGAPGFQAAHHAHIGAPFRLRVATMVFSDVAALLLTAAAALAVGEFLSQVPGIERLFSAFDADATSGMLLLFALTPVWLVALWSFGLYRDSGRSIGGMNLTDTLSGLTALTATAWMLLIVLVLALGRSAPVAQLIAFWAIAVVAVPACRWVTRHTLWNKAELRERVLIIGAGEVGHTVADKISKHREYHAELIGFLDDGEPRTNGHTGPELPILGSLVDLPAAVSKHHVDRVIVAFSQARHSEFLRVVRACADSDVQVNIVPRLFEVVSSRALVDDVEGIPLLDIGYAELSRFNMGVKRIFDLVVGSLLFLLMLPAMVALAIIVKVDSRGPVFFRQERMGRGGKTFRIFKFRSMERGADKRGRSCASKTSTPGRCSR